MLGDDDLIRHRFDLYRTFQRPFIFTPGDNEWTDCDRVNNGKYDPLERLRFIRSLFFPEVGQTTGGHVRPVQSQAEAGTYSEFVENVMFEKQGVMLATVHVVGSNNGGDDHFFFVDQPLSNVLFSRVQTYGERLVHWVKVHVDPKSSGVFQYRTEGSEVESLAT